MESSLAIVARKREIDISESGKVIDLVGVKSLNVLRVTVAGKIPVTIGWRRWTLTPHSNCELENCEGLIERGTKYMYYSKKL